MSLVGRKLPRLEIAAALRFRTPSGSSMTASERPPLGCGLTLARRNSPRLPGNVSFRTSHLADGTSDRSSSMRTRDKEDDSKLSNVLASIPAQPTRCSTITYGHCVSEWNASTTIRRTIADAGSARSANRPASSRERVGHVFICNVMGRCGIGVGAHIARR